MIPADYQIATNQGRATVTGFVGAFLGIAPGPRCWTVTLLHTGTIVSSLFPDKLRDRDALAAAVDALEAACPFQFYALSDLPWGAIGYEPHHIPAAEAIKRAAGVA